MSNNKINFKKNDIIFEKRNKAVYHKSHEFIQKARYDLSTREWNIVHFAMSMIKESDTSTTEYTLNLAELYEICGCRDESYTRIKVILNSLASKAWWMPTMRNGKECESLVRWFNTIDIERQSQKVIIKFHENMMKYIFALFAQYEEYGRHYASLMLKYSLPMKKKYSPRLYELLMSYKINNEEWWFSVEKLKHLLNCRNYKTWQHFRDRALDPAIAEINKFTDIDVWYEITDKTAKRVNEITFYMKEKPTNARIQAEKDGLTQIEGPIHYWDEIDGQMNLLDGVEE
jgi:plasmid replication initiation protein